MRPVQPEGRRQPFQNCEALGLEGKKASGKGNLGQEKEWSTRLAEVRSRDEWKQKHAIEEGRGKEARGKEKARSPCSQ